MKVPFFDYKRIYAESSASFDSAFRSVASNGSFIMQDDLHLFEQELASFIGCKYVVGVADGTAALEFSLIASGISLGDEVIMSTHTFIASAAAVNHVGAIPIVVDCDRFSSIDPSSVICAITPRTKAIMPTQLNGRVCDMNSLNAIAQQHSLSIVEDSCQSLGATYNSTQAGLFGLCGSYSFFPAKTLGCFGDGGAVSTNSTSAYETILELRNHGRDNTGYVANWGYNGRLDNLQAALLRIKLRSYSASIERRRAIASIYCDELSDISGIDLPASPNSVSGNERYDIFQNFEIATDSRDDLKKFLSSKGIGTIVQWNGWFLHQFGDLGLSKSCPFGDVFRNRILLLPMNQYLTTDEVYYICSCIKEFYLG